MNKGETITIRKAGNGFIVEGLTDRHTVMSAESMLVFNELGMAQPMTNEPQPYLLGFIQDHFRESTGKKEGL